METMGIVDHIAVLRTEGARIAELAARTDPDAPVPTCPEWRLRDLVRHTGQVHRWATAHIEQARPAPLTPEETAALWGPDASDAELASWFRDGHQRLVAALEQAPAGLECWSFLPAPSPLAFWARRQAHETAVHRADAEAAAGGESTGLSAAFAVDGIEELLFGMLGRPGRYKLHTERPRTLLIKPTDTEPSWLVTISQDTLASERTTAEAADCTLTGTARELYLHLWNRLPLGRLAMSGDRSLLELWRETAQIRWS